MHKWFESGFALTETTKKTSSIAAPVVRVKMDTQCMYFLDLVEVLPNVLCCQTRVKSVGIYGNGCHKHRACFFSFFCLCFFSPKGTGRYTSFPFPHFPCTNQELERVFCESNQGTSLYSSFEAGYSLSIY